MSDVKGHFALEEPMLGSGQQYMARVLASIQSLGGLNTTTVSCCQTRQSKIIIRLPPAGLGSARDELWPVPCAILQ